MGINITLLGQMITFSIFIWFTMKYVWPLLDEALVERKNKITSGLAKAEKGEKILVNAKIEVDKCLKETKKHCADLVQEANYQAVKIVEEAEGKARQEMECIISSARDKVTQEILKVKLDLKDQLADLVTQGTEQILKRTIRGEDHDSVFAEISAKWK